MDHETDSVEGNVSGQLYNAMFGSSQPQVANASMSLGCIHLILRVEGKEHVGRNNNHKLRIEDICKYLFYSYFVLFVHILSSDKILC